MMSKDQEFCVSNDNDDGGGERQQHQDPICYLDDPPTPTSTTKRLLSSYRHQRMIPRHQPSEEDNGHHQHVNTGDENTCSNCQEDKGGEMKDHLREMQHPQHHQDEDCAMTVLKSCPKEKLLPADVLVHLLKIQAKYLDDHPCLCTSRFRHALHSLDHERHRKLAEVCRRMQRIQSKSSMYEITKLYGAFVERIFEFESLEEAAQQQQQQKQQQSKCGSVEGQDGKGAGSGNHHGGERKSCTPPPPSRKLMRLLEAVLARLVSDYRAIFAIEDQELQQKSEGSSSVPGVSSSSSLQSLDHEHRKRHEEEDDCPEEIKLMRVAQDLTLHCPSDASNTSNKSQKPLKSGVNPQANTSPKGTEKGEAISGENGDAVRASSKPCSDEICCQNASASMSTSKSSSNLRKRKEERRDAGYEQEDNSRNKFSRASSDVWCSQSADNDNLVPDCCQNSIKRCSTTPDLEHKVLSDIKQESSSSQHPGSSSQHHQQERVIAHPARRTGRNVKEARSDSLKENNNNSSTEVSAAGKSKKDRNSDANSSPPSSCSSSTTSGSNPSSPNAPINATAETERKPLCESISAPPSITSSIPIISGGGRDLLYADSPPVKSWDHLLRSSPLDSSSVEGSPSPMSEQQLSWVPPSLRREDSETETTDEFTSTRAFGLIHSQRHLDPSHAMSPRSASSSSLSGRRGSDPETGIRRTKLKQLRRQLSNLRRRMEELEIDYESRHGYKPSQGDKLGHKEMRRVISEQSSLKKQIRSYRDEDNFCFLDNNNANNNSNGASPVHAHGSSSPISIEMIIQGRTSSTNRRRDSVSSSSTTSNEDDEFVGSSNNNNEFGSRDLESFKDSLKDLEADLRAQRAVKGRPHDLDSMTTDQLMSEKEDLHSALVRFEGTFGPPETAEEKELTREVYDRYRTVKRLVRRSSLNRAKDQIELATIPENEAIDLTLASPQHRINIEVHGQESNNQEQDEQQQLDEVDEPRKMTKRGVEGYVGPKSERVETEFGVKNKIEKDESEDGEVSLHAMSRYELLQVARKTREEKRRLRRQIKEREESIQRETGRKPLKEERDRSEGVYQSYKNAKAKLKLIDALLSKQAVDSSYF